MVDTCWGIDVSSYQAPQNWGALAASGLAFAFAKASEGQHTRDTRFAAHIAGIKAAGLVAGAYHFAWPNQDPVAESANYIGAVRPYASRGFVHWLDLERRGDGANYAGMSDAGIRAWASRWITEVSGAFPGHRVGVYTSGDDIARGHAPAGVPLWYPSYPGSAVNTYTEAAAHVRPSPSGRVPLFWQFTSDPIDRSVCYLSKADLRAWAAGEDPVMPLSADDIAAVADAVFRKLVAAGGVLEAGDLDRVYTKLLKTDGVLPAASDAPDRATNPFWAWQTHVTATTDAARHAASQADVIAAQAAANGETLSKILLLLGQLGQGGLADQLRAQLEAIKLSITVE